MLVSSKGSGGDQSKASENAGSLVFLLPVSKDESHAKRLWSLF